MRKPLKAGAALLFIFTFLCDSSLSADTLTLSTTNGGIASFELSSNNVAQIVSSYGGCGDGSSQITITAAGGVATYNLNTGGINYTHSSSGSTDTIAIPPPTIAGPATIALTNGCPAAVPPQLTFCTIHISPVRSITTSPSTALVVPNDGGRPVTIILESSVDLFNWAPAQPGTYSATTATNRFFRIRAER